MPIPIIDTHLHLIYQERLRYPWLADVPKLNRDFRLADYMAQAPGLGIETARVLVRGIQTSTVREQLLEDHPVIFY